MPFFSLALLEAGFSVNYGRRGVCLAMRLIRTLSIKNEKNKKIASIYRLF
jgi:hypothetical protein